VRFCAVSSDGRWVATGSHSLWEGSGAKVWEAGTGRLVCELPIGEICWVDFSPDGQWLVTTSGGLRLWSVGDWQPGPRLSEVAVHCAFASDGPLLAAEDVPGVVRLLVAETGREVARISSNEATRLKPLCFSRDGGLLVTYGRETEMLHVFDLRAIRQQLAELGLDWDQPPLPLAAPVDDGLEWTIDVQLSEPPPNTDALPLPGLPSQ
jgi:eukaryotic-like serine/threonine-protein kinase